MTYDLLAFLVEQMIELNRRKQAEQNRFQGWLEGALRVKQDSKGRTGLNALAGKTKLFGYLGDYQKGEDHRPFDELLDVLHRSRTRITGVSPSDPRFVARFREEHEKSLAVLLPIKEQLAFTDDMIDQVVYRLYGLTEEEVAVVEGKVQSE